PDASTLVSVEVFLNVASLQLRRTHLVIPILCLFSNQHGSARIDSVRLDTCRVSASYTPDQPECTRDQPARPGSGSKSTFSSSGGTPRWASACRAALRTRSGCRVCR